MKAGNKKLDDITLAYFEDGSNQSLDEELRVAKFQTRNQILRVTNPELANTLGLSTGKIYCYYKPSFIIDGYENLNVDRVNLEMMQAIDGKFRDDYTITKDKLKGISGSMLTQNKASEAFNEAFQSSG